MKHLFTRFTFTGFTFTGLSRFTAVLALVMSLWACGGAEERKAKYLEKGKAYLAEKNYDKAKIEIKNVLQIDPKSADAYFVMGQIQEKDKEYGKALGYYKKAVELDPVHMGAKIRLSKIYVIIGTKDLIEEARKLLNEAKKVQPEDPQVGLILSTIDYKLGKKEKATLALEAVVAKNNSFAEGVSLLAAFYTSNGASDDNPKDVFLKVTLAKLLAKKKDYKGAEKYLTQSVSIDPQNYSLQIALSLFYTNTDQKDKAEVILRKAIEQDDNDVQRYLMLVEFLDKSD